MKSKKLNRKIFLILASVIVLAALPATSLAQGRGRGRGQEKKLEKFVNGHDARDGRWDRRDQRWGRRTVVSNNIVRQRRADRIRYRNFEREQRLRNRIWHRRAVNQDQFVLRQRLQQRRWERRRFVRRY